MFIWFVVAAPFLVAEIFKSPMVDYRLVALGAVLPLVEVFFGQAFVLHTLLAPVVVLTVVMLTTMNRRLVRRRLLGIPIGMFLHLVLDGTWSSATLFWWPAFGFSLADQPVPESTGIGWRIVLEILGVALAVFAYRRYDLDQPPVRARLARTGHLTAARATRPTPRAS
ncbi:MAG: hypothetical protein AAF531_25455 [Actinomycetota bacterium]